MSSKVKSSHFIRGSLTQLYKMAVKGKDTAYNLDLLPTHKIEGATVISVGNLRLGGSGKTPLAMLLCEILRDKGLKPAYVSRGYRGAMENKGGLVSIGDGPIVSAKDAGDEAFMAAQKLAGVLVRVGANRVKQARFAVTQGANAIVLDDGFQHRRIFRDLDLLLVSPEDLNPKTRLLPFGPLREPPESAARANLIIGLSRHWKDKGNFPDVIVDYRPCKLIEKSGSSVSLKHHLAKPVFLLAAIAQPMRFEQTAKDAGFKITGRSFFSDHHPFTKSDISKVCNLARKSRAQCILTTEKDLPKLAHLNMDMPLEALAITLVITRGKDLLYSAINNIT